MVGIKDFDMPKDCKSCKYKNKCFYDPMIDSAYLAYEGKKKDNCPLVEAIPKAEVKKFLEEGAKNISNNVLAIVREDYIHKADYEARLKADMVAMLEDLDLQIDESASYNLEVAKVQRMIRDRINALKEDKE